MPRAEPKIRWQAPASPREIARQIHAAVQAVERAKAPKDAGISHFGLRMTIGTEEIGIAARGGRLQFTVYRTHDRPIGAQTETVTCPACGDVKHPPTYHHPGYPKRVHVQRMQALAKAFGAKVHEHWNGGTGHHGISVVLARPCPPSLLSALNRGPTSPVSYSDWASHVTKGAAS